MTICSSVNSCLLLALHNLVAISILVCFMQKIVVLYCIVLYCIVLYCKKKPETFSVKLGHSRTKTAINMKVSDFENKVMAMMLYVPASKFGNFFR